MRIPVSVRVLGLVLGLLLGVMLAASPATAYVADDPANCVGVDWDDTSALVVSKVIASPHVNFIKSPYDDDFKAETCPAATDVCRKKAYLVTGDLAAAPASPSPGSIAANSAARLDHFCRG
jgi:hypothetical protein